MSHKACEGGFTRICNYASIHSLVSHPRLEASNGLGAERRAKRAHCSDGLGVRASAPFASLSRQDLLFNLPHTQRRKEYDLLLTVVLNLFGLMQGRQDLVLEFGQV